MTLYRKTADGGARQAVALLAGAGARLEVRGGGGGDAGGGWSW